ncbi:MAG: integrase core domain-containing protein [Vicinamibacterales bacterium]
MGTVPPLLSFLLMIAAGWVHRHQLIVIEFLQAENRLLKDRLRGRRIRFTDAERALLARKAKAVGRKALLELDTIVSPDTLLRWHRRLVAQKWNFAERRGAGRPGIMRHISALIVQMAQENPGRGYTRIQGALANLSQDSGANVIRLPPMSPNLNAYAERFVRSIKDECLDRMILIGQGSLRRAVAEYMEHYHLERNHQGLVNRLIVPMAMEAKDGAVLRHVRLGGILNFYCGTAA